MPPRLPRFIPESSRLHKWTINRKKKIIERKKLFPCHSPISDYSKHIYDISTIFVLSPYHRSVSQSTPTSAAPLVQGGFPFRKRSPSKPFSVRHYRTSCPVCPHACLSSTKWPSHRESVTLQPFVLLQETGQCSGRWGPEGGRREPNRGSHGDLVSLRSPGWLPPM